MIYLFSFQHVVVVKDWVRVSSHAQFPRRLYNEIHYVTPREWHTGPARARNRKEALSRSYILTSRVRSIQLSRVRASGGDDCSQTKHSSFLKGTVMCCAVTRILHLSSRTVLP